MLLRGLIDAGDYKQFIFPLLFFKRVSDVWDEEYQAALASSNGDLRTPSSPRTTASRSLKVRTGMTCGRHRRTSARPSRRPYARSRRPTRILLDGIFGDAPWTNQERLPDETLKNLIEHFSPRRSSVANVPEDELGNAYEYLIKKFADDSGHTAAEFYTNRTVVHLMTQLLRRRPASRSTTPPAAPAAC